MHPYFTHEEREIQVLKAWVLDIVETAGGVPLEAP